MINQPVNSVTDSIDKKSGVHVHAVSPDVSHDIDVPVDSSNKQDKPSDIVAFLNYMDAYLRSGNDVAVERVYVPAHELRRLIDLARDRIFDEETGYWL